LPLVTQGSRIFSANLSPMDYTTLTRQFANPPAAYRPMMFWIWNGDLTPEGIEEQIADFAAKGCGGFFIHPMGENFRLQDFIRGMNPPYLSDEYFALVRHAVEAAQRHGLYAWLYDEGGWPSGTAQGHVTAGHPELRGKRLHARRVQALDLPDMPANTVAAVGLPELGVPAPVDLRELAQGLWPYDELILFTVEDDGYPVDVLNAEAVRRFIEVTHERYAEVVGEFFGDTVPGIFTDETSLGGRLGGAAVPWFGGMLELLTESMGRDARTYLPLLFAAEVVGDDLFGRYSGHEIVAARCEYYDVLTRRFGESYWRQIGDWCAAHGLIHTGHVGGEDNLPDNLSFGHFFRTAGALHAPGVDVIWRQLFPGQEVFPFPRLAASALKHTAPDDSLPAPDSSWAGAVITETNAVYGYGLHYGQMRWLLDIQAQHGVNLYAPMASAYTTSEGRIFCTMSHCGPGNPLWPSYRAFADYVGRVCLLARHSREEARVAVYYPLEALWTIDGAPEAWESLQSICRSLCEHHIAFDFVDADVLQECTAQIGSGVCATTSYELFIVPAVVAMPARAAAKLAELREAAAGVVVLGHWPLHPSEMSGLAAFNEAIARLSEAGVAPLSPARLAGTLAEVAPTGFEVSGSHPKLVASLRGNEAAQFCVLTNNSARTQEPALAFDATTPAALEVWDVRDGEVIALPWRAGVHAQEARPVLPPWSSLWLGLRPLAPDEAPVTAAWPEEALALERWLSDPAHRSAPPVDVVAEFTVADRVQVVRQHVIAGGDVQLVPEDELPVPYEGEPAPLADWSEWPLPPFSGAIAYEFELLVADELIERPLLLDLGQVFWTAHIELNGESVGDMLWAPYVLDVTGYVRAGTNRLRVTVANTLANDICRPEVEAEARERGWCNPYVERTLPMMREDLRSGLLGPVRLLVAAPHV
jgi:hypothetical protein